MEFTELIIFGLATWRLGSLLIDENGPFSIFCRIRDWAAWTNVAFLNELLSCIWCVTVWVGFFFAASKDIHIVNVFAVALSLSAIAIIMNRIVFERNA